MIMIDFDNNFPWPYFLFNKGVAIINTDDEVDGGSEDEGFMLGDVEIEMEGIFVGGIEAEG